MIGLGISAFGYFFGYFEKNFGYFWLLLGISPATWLRLHLRSLLLFLFLFFAAALFVPLYFHHIGNTFTPEMNNCQQIEIHRRVTVFFPFHMKFRVLNVNQVYESELASSALPPSCFLNQIPMNFRHTRFGSISSSYASLPVV